MAYNQFTAGNCPDELSLSWVFYEGSFQIFATTRDLGSGTDADWGSGSKEHFASTQPQFGSDLRAMLRDIRDSAWEPVQQFNA